MSFLIIGSMWLHRCMLLFIRRPNPACGGVRFYIGDFLIDSILCGDCKGLLPTFADNYFDAIITDPPYELTQSKNSKKGFMGKAWDGSGIAYDVDMWAGCLRVLKPGGHMLVFGGDRTHHRMFCAIEDAGFDIRRTIVWTFGSGFPKSLSIDKAIDKYFKAEREVIGRYTRPDGTTVSPSGNNTFADGGFPNTHTLNAQVITAPSHPLAKQWAGFGSDLKPAAEMICLARKPLDGCTIAENVIKWSCGGLNIDKCRIPSTEHAKTVNTSRPFDSKGIYSDWPGAAQDYNGGGACSPMGRFPANLILDGSDAVKALFPETKSGSGNKNHKAPSTFCASYHKQDLPTIGGDSGSASRFFAACPFTEDDIEASIPPLIYMAKASRSERERGLDGMPARELSHSTYMKCSKCGKPILDGRSETCNCPDKDEVHQQAKNFHPTVKPLALMRYLCRLICPPGGLILDPFAGSGTTCMAAKAEGFGHVGIEKEPEYVEIAKRRVAATTRSITTYQS